MKQKKNLVVIMLYLLFVLFIIYGVSQLLCYYYDAYHKKQNANELAEQVLVWEDKVEQTIDKQEENEIDATNDIPDHIDFETLLLENQDVVGWIYCPDTAINYPIVKGENNDTYLHLDLHGKYSKAGTLFVEETNSREFSDLNTIIYGHNMKSGAMFHDITKYVNQDFYQEHPVMYLYTPEKRYEIRLLMGCITNTDDSIYQKIEDTTQLQKTLNRFSRKSTFASNETFIEGDHLITLSTCSYEYDDARYVLIGRLVLW